MQQEHIVIMVEWKPIQPQEVEQRVLQHAQILTVIQRLHEKIQVSHSECQESTLTELLPEY